MKCVICKRGLNEGLTLHRINAKGQPGLWACERHLGQTDAQPVDPQVREIVDALKS